MFDVAVCIIPDGDVKLRVGEVLGLDVGEHMLRRPHRALGRRVYVRHERAVATVKKIKNSVII